MIDFENAAFVKLRPVNPNTFNAVIEPILIDEESVVGAYQTIRDGVVFTTHRIITINIQGITGKKKDFTSLPYRKIQAFSIETAGAFDLDAELDLWFSGMGHVRLEILSGANIMEICRLISENVLE